MKIINAKEATNITEQAKARAALYRTSFAECCVKEDIMPRIVEEADRGKDVVVIDITLNSDAYRVRDLILSILTGLGYVAKLGENGSEFIIEW